MASINKSSEILEKYPNEEIIKNNVGRFRNYLEKSIMIKDIVGHFKIFTREQRKLLLQISKTDPTAATAKALDLIDHLDHPEKYRLLLEVIDNAGYPKLGGLLRGKLLVGKNDVHRQRINDMTSVIYQRLNPFDVVPYLIQHGVISRDEGADICKIADKSRSHAALELQYILPNRHRHWYILTLCALMESSHKELAEILDSGLMKHISDNHCNELYRTGSDTSLQTLVESCYTHVDDLKGQLDAVVEKVLALKDNT